MGAGPNGQVPPTINGGRRDHGARGARDANANKIAAVHPTRGPSLRRGDVPLSNTDANSAVHHCSTRDNLCTPDRNSDGGPDRRDRDHLDPVWERRLLQALQLAR